MPLIEGTDGTEKMSKSLGNYIGVDEAPETMFAKIMSISDELMLKYYRLLTTYTPVQIEELEQALATGSLHPRWVKKELGINIVDGYYGREEAEKAAQQFEKIHQAKEVPDEIPGFTYTADDGKPGVWIVKLLTASGLVPSSSQGRRLIQQGGIRIDGEQVTNVSLELERGKEYILQVGRRRFLRVRVL